jgi:hypothetical protein
MKLTSQEYFEIKKALDRATGADRELLEKMVEKYVMNRKIGSEDYNRTMKTVQGI